MYISIAVSGKSRPPTTRVFSKPEITLGRSSSNDIVFDPLSEGQVSRRHAVIRQMAHGQWELEDLSSTQGTFVNNQPVRDLVTLRSRDTLMLGIDGPRLNVMFDRDKVSTHESGEMLRAPTTSHFPLALYRDFPARFRVYQKIGEGGYGQVWRAKNDGVSPWKAIKFLRPELLLSSPSQSSVLRVDHLVERFQREARVTRMLAEKGTPGIVPVEEAGGDPREGFVYMIMEYVKGESLDQLVSRREEVDPGVACRYASNVARALDAAHNFVHEEDGQHLRGIVHRDVKPSNILIRQKTDEAVLVDFGIAGFEEGGERLTLPQMRVFTYKFTAPEVLLSNEISPMTDLWGLAVTTYVLLSGGFFPYGGMGLSETLKAIESREMAPLNTHRRGLPDDLCAFVEQGLDPDPAKRPATAKAWVETMARFATKAKEKSDSEQPVV